MKVNRRVGFYVLLSFISILLVFCVLEISSRVLTSLVFQELSILIRQHQSQLQRSLTNKPQFQSHPYLAYTPSDVEITNDGCIIGDTHFTFTKPESTIRVACLGGSTTKNAYTRWLREPLQQIFPSKKIEVMDWGCQGWTMAESTINYLIRVQHFSPNVVILHHGINDLAPRVRKDFIADYSHYRKPFLFQSTTLINRIASYSTVISWIQLLVGVRPGDLNMWTVKPNPGPVSHYPNDETTLIYKNGIETISHLSNSNDSKLIAAGMIYSPTGFLNQRNIDMLKEHNSIMQEVTTSHNNVYVDLQSLYQHYPEWFLDRCHLRNPGNQSKAQWFANTIASELNQKPILTAAKVNNDNRKILIEWEISSDQHDELSLYVQINHDTPEWIATVNGNQSSYLWDPTDSKDFTGNQYRFLLQRIKDGKNHFGPIIQAEPIQFDS